MQKRRHLYLEYVIPHYTIKRAFKWEHNSTIKMDLLLFLCVFFLFIASTLFFPLWDVFKLQNWQRVDTQNGNILLTIQTELWGDTKIKQNYNLKNVHKKSLKIKIQRSHASRDNKKLKRKRWKPTHQVKDDIKIGFRWAEKVGGGTFKWTRGKQLVSGGGDGVLRWNHI